MAYVTPRWNPVNTGGGNLAASLFRQGNNMVSSGLSGLTKGIMDYADRVETNNTKEATSALNTAINNYMGNNPEASERDLLNFVQAQGARADIQDKAFDFVNRVSKSTGKEAAEAAALAEQQKNAFALYKLEQEQLGRKQRNDDTIASRKAIENLKIDAGAYKDKSKKLDKALFGKSDDYDSSWVKFGDPDSKSGANAMFDLFVDKNSITDRELFKNIIRDQLGQNFRSGVDEEDLVEGYKKYRNFLR